MKKLLLIGVMASFTFFNGNATNVSSSMTTHTASDETQSTFAGLYVQQHAGGNTMSYEIKYKASKYTGIYEEHLDGGNEKIVLTNIIINELDKTISFKQGKHYMKGRFTNKNPDGEVSDTLILVVYENDNEANDPTSFYGKIEL